MANIHDGIVEVSSLCTGNGTEDHPWESPTGSAGIKEAIGCLNATTTILRFAPGIYKTTGVQEIAFEDCLAPAVKADSKTIINLMQNGIRLVGYGSQIWLNGRQPMWGNERNPNRPGLLFRWSSTPQIDSNFSLFFWSFVGLNFIGDIDNVLVQFGLGKADTIWNSCEFDIVANNGSTHDPLKSNARGLLIYRPLESRLNLVATSATGYGCVLNTAEFSALKGSFSNAQVSASESDGVIENGVGLLLIDCQSNAFTAINLEVCYYGMQWQGNTRSNTFNCIISNNGDERGCILKTEDVADADQTKSNVIVTLNRRTTLQNKTRDQPFLYSYGSSPCVVSEYPVSPGVQPLCGQ